MATLTRRRFLRQTSVGVAATSVLAAAPGLAAAAGPSIPAAAEPSVAALREPLIAHVRDYATGEIALLVGAREIVYHDPELVARLVRAARLSSGSPSA